MNRIGLLAILLVALLLGCNSKENFEAMVPQSEAENAKKLLASFADGRFDDLVAVADGELASGDALGKFSQFRAQLPSGGVSDVMVTGYGSNTLVNTGTKTYEIYLQGRYTDQWTVTWLTFKGPEGHEKLIGFHFQPLSDRLEHLNKFSLNGKPVLNYVMLLLAVLIAVFVLVTLFACIRTRIPKRKWLWCIFVCLGFVGISLNWASGVVSIDPIRVYIPGIAVTAASPYAPWVITVSVPIGAILFWFKRRKWLRQDSAG